MDLVDAITEWSHRGNEELNEDDIDAILRIQLAIDSSAWSQVDVATLTASDIAAIKAELHDVDAPAFTAWVIDESLDELGLRPAPEPDAAPSFDAWTEATPVIQDEPVETSTILEDFGRQWSNGDELAAGEEGGLFSTSIEPEAEPFDADQPEQPPTAEADDLEGIEAAGKADDPVGAGSSSDADTTRTPDVVDAALEGDGDPAPAPGGAFSLAATSTAPAVDDPRDDAVEREFFAQLAEETDARLALEPLEFREGPDALGPTFLPPPRRTRMSWFALAVVSIAAIVAFVVFGLRLVDDISKPDEEDVAEVATADDVDREESEEADDGGTTDVRAEPDPDEGADTAEADASGLQTATDADHGDEADAAADDEPETEAVDPVADDDEQGATAAPATDEAAAAVPAEDAAVILTAAGEVLWIDLLPERAGDPRLLFGGPDGEPAQRIGFVDGGLTIVTESGDVAYLAFDELDDPMTIWDADELGPAVSATDVDDRYVVLAATGSIAIFEKDRVPTERNISRAWDTAQGGTPPARELGRYQDLVPFVIGNGDVRMLTLSGDGVSVVPVWSATAQPPAFNLEITEHGLLMGVGAGGVARFAWFEDDALTAVWNPFDGSRLPAIGYAAADGATAIVLNNGSVALIDETGSGPIMWDAEIADLRAVDVHISPTEALLEIDGGSVLRVDPAGQSESRGAIWDVTDEALSPAAQVLLLDR